MSEVLKSEVENLIQILEGEGINRKKIIVPDLEVDSEEVTILLRGQFSKEVWEAISEKIAKNITPYANWTHGASELKDLSGKAIVYQYANDPEFTLKKEVLQLN